MDRQAEGKVVVFSKAEFEAALPIGSKSGEPLWEYNGLDLGEHCYHIPVHGTNKRIMVRSSVKGNGYSAASGKDSIRHWNEYYYKGKWFALGKHTSAYTTRVPGWEKRLVKKLRELYQAALDDSDKCHAEKNPQPGSPEGSPAEDGENDNPPLLEDNSLNFLGGEATVELPSVEIVPETPRCPKCDRKMIKRARHSDGNKFWGCPSFPKCRGTRKIEQQPKPVAVQEPEREITWSDYQNGFFVAVEEEAGNLVLIAVAGSGKTVTLVEALKYVSKTLKVAYLAFNKRAADTLAGVAPPHVHASTFHSLGLSNACRSLGKVEVDTRKLFYIIRAIKDSLAFEEAMAVDAAMGSIQRIVSMCKATLVEPTPENISYIVNRWHIELDGDRELIQSVAAQAYRESVINTKTVDFDDMIHLCATGKIACEQFDALFVDETQDLNKAQLEMACRSVKDGGRIIVVGDPAQSIYGFRGADTEAIPRIIERLDAKVMPLSITYRCPKSHVRQAQQFVPEIEAAPWAKEGIIAEIKEFQLGSYVRPGDLVICRVNAPLVKPAFSLIRQGIKAVILGRDIGTGLLNLVKKVQKRARVHTLDDTLAELNEYCSREVYKLRKAKKDMRAESLIDRVETIFALSDGCYTMADLERKIEQVFSDDEAGVTFSSIHKIKGGEADRVFILKPELMPHPKATSAWELDQERNIQYVAYTRSKSELYFVT